MLMEYMQAGLNNAKYEILKDKKIYYGEIPQCKGVYVTAKNLEDCRLKLKEVFEEWVFIRIYRHLNLPVFDGVRIKIKETV